MVTADHRLFLSLTVLLETGWVLASRYQMRRDDIATALAALIALDAVDLARAELVDWTIERFRASADWADVMHRVASRKLEGVVTFDRRLARHAGERAPVPVATLS